MGNLDSILGYSIRYTRIRYSLFAAKNIYKIASYKRLLNGTALALSCDRHKKGKIRWNTLAKKQAQLIPCTVLFFDK